ncbi:GNAT family N-acetyltransferase [Cohnella cellulosilytica]|uniref:GNAT family N-acetyltransferase n=1 Tax=Cohnella cellulosilytica TaxID=986710 RepID=A0ABW2FJ49_9BACL
MIRKEYDTSRLKLRTIEEKDAPQVLEFVQRNERFLQPWEPERTPDFFTPKRQRELLRFDQSSMALDQLFKVWLYKKDEPNRVIGSIALSNIVRGVFQSCHLGYRLDGAEINRGYMAEALQAVVSIAFGELRLHRIEANIMPHNAASLRLVEKLGFQPEGMARKYLKINGKWEDHVHMTLINEEMD